MPFKRPTLPQLIDQGAAEFESRLPGVLARARNSVVGVINRVLAGALSALYKYVEYLNEQMWPDRAAPEFLIEHGARWGVTRLAAAPATGTVTFTGTNGVNIPAATTVQRADGVQYTTTAAGLVAAGVAAVPVQAVLPGIAANAAVATSANLTTPIAGINSVATAQTALAGGADLEAIEPWRARILARIRKPPQGGADFDYVAWALAVPGVTRVWVYANEQGLGTVVIRFVRDNDASPLPSAGAVAAVQAAINLVRPVTANAIVVAPIALVQNFTIQLLPDSAATRAAVTSELAQLYRRAAAPGGTMLISQQREAISISTGEADHVLSLPVANQVAATGQLPTLGVITWL